MGVTGLWTVVAPTARPTKLETLNRKRLAVDASIWIYQFLKAVRDKEGNALRNSHVVGFFRRICKLLYFGVQPVFVFDGGAPTLKRETVRTRARRREGRREDAARTAGKLLAVQVARAAEEEDKRRKAERERTPIEDELPPDQELVYVDEIGMDQKERQAGRGFKKKDQYHLPDLDVSIESMGAPNDPRIMSQAELEEYARQFHSGEDVNLYDFSKIDFDSPFFLSLPPGDRYNILNAARLRSRLRMGYSKEQLDNMFPDRMAFSKFQVERVKERNELTQRLMHINGMSEDSWNQGGRIVGEKGKEYVLVKNDGVEGGWALGVVSNREGSKQDNAIDVDESDRSSDGRPATEDEDDFEDVAIEGLNRIPKSWQRPKKGATEVDYDVSYEDAAAMIAKKREAIYSARRKAAQENAARKDVGETTTAAEQSLFVPDNQAPDAFDDQDDLFEDVPIAAPNGDEEDDLQKAIAMSLEVDDRASLGEAEHDEQTARDTREDGELDLGRALAESRKSKYVAKTNVRDRSPMHKDTKESTFTGPLPFESLKLGQSLLGKKKAKKVEEELSGGFDRDLNGAKPKIKAKRQPVPSWFDAEPSNREPVQKELDDEHDTLTAEYRNMQVTQQKLRRPTIHEVIDVDSSGDESSRQSPEQPKHSLAQAGWDPAAEPHDSIEVVDEPIIEDKAEEDRKAREAEDREKRYQVAREIAAESGRRSEENVEVQRKEAGLQDPKPSDTLSTDQVADHAQAEPPKVADMPAAVPNFQPPVPDQSSQQSGTDEGIEWSDSDGEGARMQVSADADTDVAPEVEVHASGYHKVEEPQELSDEEAFEDVEISGAPDGPHVDTREGPAAADHLLVDATEEQEMFDAPPDADNYFSDSDEELMRQLAIETEEHARFAADLNNTKSTEQATRDYESELKQLRNQQKKDRRDADEVTQVMIQECQALLRLFGLPYITAPMEAEAQCAELVHLGLVDGIVTDDSDIFLFGGTRIYKNMFNAAKFVECYVASDLEKEYALDRQKLIRFAHLLGSDYTEGIPGIGPVTALEIISDFDDLQQFKQWCAEVQLGRLDGELTTAFRRKFKNTVQKRLFLPNSFPDVRVDHAYLEPDVDSDPQDFQWGVPDLGKLRSFLMATIGWSQDRTDEILVPVIRDMNKREQEGTQSNITRFFAGGVGVGVGVSSTEGSAPRNRTGKESGRMKNAYTRLRGEAKKRRLGFDPDEAADDDGLAKAQVDHENDESSDTHDGDDDGKVPNRKRVPRTHKRSRKKSP